MIRVFSLSLLALGLASLPASAQDTPATPADSVALDSVATDSVEVIEADPERARGLYNEGRGFLQASDFENALAKFDEALVYNETYAAASLGRAQALAQLGRYEDSRSAAEATVALAEASDISNAETIKGAAERLLAQVNQVMEARAQAQAQSQQAAAQQETTGKVNQAVQMLNPFEVDEATAIEAYALLEQARMAGYDADQVAFFYAKALNAMDRGADAVPYAETAVTASEGQADRSPYYYQLGLAHMSAGNTEEARAAFEAIGESDSLHGWAQHQIGQLAAGSN